MAERDGQRCSFVDEHGERCNETGMLEFHHHEPFAKGGPHSLENISLTCRAHNQQLARQDYGRIMERYQNSPDRLRESSAIYRVAPRPGPRLVNVGGRSSEAECVAVRR